MSTPLAVTRIGHACQLIEIGETRILTDPWFSQTATYYQGEPVTSTAAGKVKWTAVPRPSSDSAQIRPP